MAWQDRQNQPGDAVEATDQMQGSIYYVAMLHAAGMRKTLVAGGIDDDDIRLRNLADTGAATADYDSAVRSNEKEEL